MGGVLSPGTTYTRLVLRLIRRARRRSLVHEAPIAAQPLHLASLSHLICKTSRKKKGSASSDMLRETDGIKNTFFAWHKSHYGTVRMV